MDRLAIPLATLLVGGAAVLGLLADPNAVAASIAEPPAAGLAPLSPWMPDPDPGMEAAEISIGDGLRVNGQRVSLRQYYSDDPPSAVADHYELAFRDMGLQVQRFDLPSASYVGALAEDGRFVSVTLLPQPDGATMVVPGLSEGAFKPGEEAKRSPIPIHPSYENLLSYSSHDGGKDAVAAQYTTPLSHAQIRAWYGRTLKRAGFRIRAGSRLPERTDHEVLRFRRGHAYLTVALQALEGSAGTLVYTLLEVPQEEASE